MVERSVPKLHLPTDQIIETIVATYNVDGSPTAAPMGVIFRGTKRVEIMPHLDTRTYRNLRLQGECTVNLSVDPELFFRATFKQRRLIPSTWFLKAEKVNAPRLRVADAFLEARVRRVGSVNVKRARFLCEVVHSRVVNPVQRGYCRATFAALESIIHATRVQVFLAEGRRREAEELLALIKHYHNLAERVSAKSRYVAVTRRILEMLEAQVRKTRRSSSTPSR